MRSDNRRFHLAVTVDDLDASIADYTRRLGAEPKLVVPDSYALWRTPILNFSIRVESGKGGLVRHMGWEDPQASTLNVEHDVNGLVWEHFSAIDQEMEIKAIWPAVEYDSRD